jgi:hypothetical protein
MSDRAKATQKKTKATQKKTRTQNKEEKPARKKRAAAAAPDDLIANAPPTMNKAARIDPIDIGALPRDRLEAMAEAAEEVVNCHRVLAKTGDNIVGELLKDVETFFEWDHYPDGDIYDTETHSQYYYHAHPEDERPGEHGHFHTFLRPDGMPKGIKPAKVPDYEPKEDPDDELSHLIAISMDKFGVPIRLFTVNRWVSADVWYDAEDVITFLDYFEMDHAQPSWPVNRWVTGMVQRRQGRRMAGGPSRHQCLHRPRSGDDLAHRDLGRRSGAKDHGGAEEAEIVSCEEFIRH